MSEELERKTLRTEGLVKIYGKRTVVNDVSFTVTQGEIVGLLGPNGAGKTTSFYMTTGLVVPNAGHVFIDDTEITSMPVYKHARNGVGYLPQEASVFRKMSVEDNILSVLQMTGKPREYQMEKLESLIKEFSLQKVRKNLGDQLSGGERRRTEIARCLAIEPKFIMLDEPFAGVDPIAVEEIQNVVWHLKHRNIGILITDHNVHETLNITDRAYLLFEGRILFHGTPDELANNQVVKEKYLGTNFKLQKKVFKEMISYGDFYRHGISTYHWNKLFKREVILKHQLEISDDVSIGEDAVVVYATLLDCKRICITDNCAYHYRQREDSMLKSSVDFEKEMVRVRALYNNLSVAVSNHPQEYNLQQQVDDFITGIFIIRSGGFLSSKEDGLDNFPFGCTLSGKRVVLYGGGTFGQQLMKRFVKDSSCDIVGWLDDDYREYRRCCLNVDPVETITSIDFDYAIIASLDKTYLKSAIRRLKDYGVAENKIISVDTNKEQRAKALQSYLETR